MTFDSVPPVRRSWPSIEVDNISLNLISSVLLCLVIPMLYVSSANAGDGITNESEQDCYKVIHGGEPRKSYTEKQRLFALEQAKKCRLFGENLNKFCHKPFYEIACSLQIHPDYSQYFSMPEWEVVPYKGNEELARAMMYHYPKKEIACDTEGVNCRRKHVPGWYRQLTSWADDKVKHYIKRLESGRFQIIKSDFDLDNNGEEETVYRFHDPTCIERSGKVVKIFKEQGPQAYYAYGIEHLRKEGYFGGLEQDMVANSMVKVLQKDKLQLEPRFHQQDRIIGSQVLFWRGSTLMTTAFGRGGYHASSRQIGLQEVYRSRGDRRGYAVNDDPLPSRNIKNKATQMPSFCTVQHLRDPEE